VPLLVVFYGAFTDVAHPFEAMNANFNGTLGGDVFVIKKSDGRAMLVGVRTSYGVMTF
jgi:hypothetical protein